ncbi:MAG: hypothetical protein VKK80_05700 [Prochlorothrix sp.]|nr:hypothetical protein [Prochlorothrix sp.]
MTPNETLSQVQPRTKASVNWSDPAIIAAIIAGLLGIANTVITLTLNERLKAQSDSFTDQLENTEASLSRLNQAVFTPTITISTPLTDQTVPWILSRVSGKVEGQIPPGCKVLVVHQGTKESSQVFHLDRISEVLADGSYQVDDVYLGSESEGAGENFQISALLVSEDTALQFQTMEGEVLTSLPEYISKTVIRVTRSPVNPGTS